MPDADFHLGPRWRLFSQLTAGFAEDKKPATTPIHEIGVDLMQGFAELQQPLGEYVLTFGSESSHSLIQQVMIGRSHG